VARILYIDHYAGSVRHGMEFRPFYLSREWQKAGHEVTVVAATYSHLRQSNPTSRSSWTEEMVDGVRYVWLATPPYDGNGAGRIRNMLAFLARLRASRARLVREFEPQVVIVSSTYPFDIFSARRMARQTGARLIFELHDLWPLSPMELGGYSRWHPFIMATQFAEDYVCRHADVVVSLLPRALDHLSTRGLRADRFRYVPNGVVLEEWLPANVAPMPAEHAAVLQPAGQSSPFTVVYAGAHGLLNNLSLVVRAAHLLRDRYIRFVFVGQGPEKEGLQELSRHLGLNNVHFLPSVPKAAVPTVLAAADALLLSFAPQPLFRFGVSPNKLMDYMMASKPIVAVMRAGNNPVEEHGCGFTASPEDSQSVADCVARIAALPPDERARLGANGRRAVEQIYAYPVLARRFAECF
jgi:glycosyltransferase involved in cell wall biosynthesis